MNPSGDCFLLCNETATNLRFSFVFLTIDALKQSLVSVPGMSSGTVLGAGSIGTEIANEILELQR